MTTRKRFTVRRGDKVSIGVSIEPSFDKSTGTRQADNQGSQLVYPGDEENELYVRRAKGNITIYDLGTQPEQMSFAVPSMQMSWNTFDFGGLSTFFRNSFHSFMSLNTSSHVVTRLNTAERFPANSERLFTDLTFQRQDAAEDNYTVLVGRPDKRPLLTTINMTPFDPVPYPANQHETDWKNQSLAFNKTGQWSLALASVYFNPFDTADALHFKITNIADAAAVAVEFLVTKQDKIKIYTTPKFYIKRNTTPVELPYTIFSLPWLVPAFGPLFDDHSLYLNVGTTPQPAVSVISSEDRWTHLTNFIQTYIGSSEPVITGLELADYGTGHAIPILVAVIVKNDIRYHVWKIVANPSGETADSPVFKSTTLFPPV